MKIEIGDILKSKAQTLVNTVNCVGIMGKGIALEFKNRFPDMFKDYLQRCERKEIHLGVSYLYKSLFGPQIVNFPTKDHWKSVSKVSDIKKGLDYLVKNYRQWGITSIAIPPLGCGNGQLDWKTVGPLIYSVAKQMDIPVEIYAPYGTSPAELTISFLEKSGEPADYERVAAKESRFPFNPAWLGLVEILHRIENEPYHRPVGRTIFQKIAYVATKEGLPTGFSYHRSSYGPFCKELKIAESKLINSNLIQEERGGRMFIMKTGSGFEEAKQRYKELLEKYTSVVEKTTDLFMRVDTTQAEVIATVLFVAFELKGSKKPFISEMDVLNEVKKWKQRRRPPLDEMSIASTIRNLGMLGWLDIRPDEKLPVFDEDIVFV